MRVETQSVSSRFFRCGQVVLSLVPRHKQEAQSKPDHQEGHNRSHGNEMHWMVQMKPASPWAHRLISWVKECTGAF